MTRHRRFVLGALVWVVVATGVATLVWKVISDAGAGVAGERPVTTVTSSSGPPASAPPSGSDPAAPSTSAPDQPAGLVRRSWQGAAGVVVAACRGGEISLVSAQPSSGWSIEVDHTGPDDVRVEFENAGDDRVRVEATCVGGTPSFELDD